MTDKQEETIRAAVRVLALLDGYVEANIAGNPLLGWRGGVMTKAELMSHAQGMRKQLVRAFGPEIKGLSKEKS